MFKLRISLIAIIVIASNDILAEGIAEGGSPLYTIAVTESVRGLQKSGKDEPAKAAEVCPDCGKVHTPATQSQPFAAGGAVPVGALGVVCPQCGVVHPPAGAASDTNAASAYLSRQLAAVAGKDEGYYYCENCKIYHRRKGAEASSADHQPGPLPNLLTNFLPRAAGGAGSRSR